MAPVQAEGDTEEREVFCRTITEAIEIMISTHGMTTLPYCIVHFIMYDAIYYTRFGMFIELHRPEVLIRHIENHTDHENAKKSVLKAIVAGTASPSPSAVLRSEFHASFARCKGSLEPSLYVTVPELQRYVRHMLCEPTKKLTRAINIFSEEVSKGSFSPLFDPHAHIEAACQTFF